MPYVLGIDLGTTFTAAAIVRDGQARVAELGTKSAVVPSVLFLGGDDVVLAGDAAARRAASDPARVAREFKRRVGDPAPILLGGSPWSPQALVARLLRWTVDAVAEREGGPPERIAISHPANWGPYKQDLLGEAIRLAELSVSMLLTEPEAAAIAYAATERVDVGAVVAVYDLGGGTFDAAVLRKTATGFEILGEPEGVDRLGGVDFDAAVFGFVTAALGDAIEGLDPTDPATIAALAHLRAECVEAKEALSSDTETSVAVLLPGLHTEVRLTRAELEAMLRPPLSDTIAALRRALRSAEVTADEVDVVLLVGGSSRIPLVADLVSNELGRPVAVDAHPKHVVATGAALAAAAAPAAGSSAPPVAAVAPVGPPLAEPTVAAEPEPPAPSPAPPIPLDSPPPTPAPDEPVPVARPDEPVPAGRPRSRRRLGVLAGVALAVVALVTAGAVAASSGGGDGDGDDAEVVDEVVDEVADEDDDAGAAAGATPCPEPGTPAVCIDEVTIRDGAVLASFSTQDVTLSEPVGGRFPEGTFHAVFFFDRIDPAEGRVWGPGSPFGNPESELPGLTADQAPSSTTALCVLIQDDDGTIFAGTGNCAPLPGQI